MSNCPTCDSPRIYPSRLRSAAERIRRALTERQPYRCHVCGYRGWGAIALPDSSDTDVEELRSGGTPAPLTPEDLDRLDKPE